MERGHVNPDTLANDIDGFTNSAVITGGLYGETGVKYVAHFGLYAKCIKNLGTEKHAQLLSDACHLKDVGCFAMTELGHGSNVRQVETVAEYDEKTGEFVLNTPSQTAMKFWIGNLAKSANMAVVFAQLITKGQNEGVHVFVV